MVRYPALQILVALKLNSMLRVERSTYRIVQCIPVGQVDFTTGHASFCWRRPDDALEAPHE
jgi:hypothetical protein